MGDPVPREARPRGGGIWKGSLGHVGTFLWTFLGTGAFQAVTVWTKA